MANKATYDARSSELNIGRQLTFHKAAFFHMLFYRILIVASIATAIVFLLSLEFVVLSTYIKYLIMLVWVLFIPQIFSLAEGLSMIGSKGLAFGHLNKSYIDTISVNKSRHAVYKAVPYAVLILWVAAFCLFVYEVTL